MKVAETTFVHLVDRSALAALWLIIWVGHDLPRDFSSICDESPVHGEDGR